MTGPTRRAVVAGALGSDGVTKRSVVEFVDRLMLENVSVNGKRVERL